MSRLFTPIIKSGIEVASLIVICGEIFFLLVYHYFDVQELKDLIKNTEML
jgi:hypothetical protein